MAYDINRIKREFAAACSMASIELETPISINGRLKTTLGRVCYKHAADGETIIPSKIEFSKSFIESSSDETIKDVLLHEAAHYIATVRTGKKHGHDKYFKAICAEIGTANDKTFLIENAASLKSKYVVKCPCCGYENLYARRGKVINNIENYRCSVCGCGELEVIQNW